MNLNPRTAVIILHDILVAAFAWLGAYWLRFNLAVPPDFQVTALSTLAWVVPLQAAVFWRFGLYRGIWRFASVPDLKRIVLAVGLAALLIPLVLVLFRVSAVVPRSVLILDPLLLVMVMGGSRLAYRAWKEHRPARMLSPDSEPTLVEGAETGTPTEDVPFAAFVQEHLDRQAYLGAYPDVQSAGMDPVKHWLEYGMAEGRSFFPDAAVLHGGPAQQVDGTQWLHFTWRGKPVAVWIYDQAENALFAGFVEKHLDRQAYLEAYPDVRSAGMDPVKHWLEYGMTEGRFLYPGATVILGDIADRFDKTHWKRFTWRGNPVAVRINRPVKRSVIDQIKAQARHDPAVLAAGALAIDKLRQMDGPDLLGRGGLDVRSIFAAIPERPDVVVLMPSLRSGEAEKFAADLIHGLGSLGQINILVVITEDTARTAGNWESQSILAPLRAVRVVFWRDICGLDHHHIIPLYLARLLNALRPPRIVVINSRIGLEIIAGFGRGLSRFAKLYCAYFNLGIEGLGAPYSKRFPYRTLPFALGLTDNSSMAATLRRKWGGLPGPGVAVLPPRLQPAEASVFSARLEARRMRAECATRSLRWVWFSHGETVKDGTAILAALARMRPTDQFDLFGQTEGDLSEMALTLPNIAHKGILEDVSLADFTEHDGFLFTSLIKGMPNMVLEMSQHAIPIVLVDVSDLRDTFDDTSVHFVGHGQDLDSTAKAFSSALDRVAKLTPSETLARVEVARAQVLLRHAPAVYLRNVADIFEITFNHV
jgi:hypothetical protein